MESNYFFKKKNPFKWVFLVYITVTVRVLSNIVNFLFQKALTPIKLNILFQKGLKVNPL